MINTHARGGGLHRARWLDRNHQQFMRDRQRPWRAPVAEGHDKKKLTRPPQGR